MTEIRCPVCSTSLRICPARSRKAKNPKLFLMLVYPQDGRHFRGFIGDQAYVRKVMDRTGEVNE